MQALCVAWLYPAVSLVWSGFASIGLRTADDGEIAASLDRAQAIAVLLAIFTMLVGGIWAVRTWEYLPVSALTRKRGHLTGPIGHLLAIPVALGAALGAAIIESLAMPLATVAGAAGCYAGLLLPRWLLRAPLGRAFPIAAFSAVVMFQITLGWMHVLTPSASTSALLIVEGLGLAWAAVAAARSIASVAELAAVIASAAAPIPATLPDSAASVGIDQHAEGVLAGIGLTSDDQGQDTTVDLLNPVPGLPSLPEPAVGH